MSIVIGIVLIVLAILLIPEGGKEYVDDDFNKTRNL